MKGKAKNKKMHRGNKSDASKDDERFLDLAKNPMFREMRKKDCKVKIDHRFKQMLTSERFQERNFRVDKRGRPVKKSGEEYLSHLYNYELDNSGRNTSGSEDDQVQEAQTCQEERAEGNDSDINNENDEEERDEELPLIQFDLARGQGNISSSSDDEPEAEDVDEEVEQMEDWAELDKEVRRVEWASLRLAICNLDWSKVRAEDLMLALSSLKPSNGEIKSVSVYLSDFGAECIEKEKKHGPFLNLKLPKKGDDDDLDERTKLAIRAYELDKLRYYYAVCVCDSIETATSIYEACDGVEYESSGLRFDIRFVPDEMQFEHERIRDQVSSDQFDVNLYKPRKIVSHALAESNPKMTWDAMDSERKRTLKQAFDENAKLEEFESLIASGSEDEDVNEKKANYEILLEAAKGNVQMNFVEGVANEDEEDHGNTEHETQLIKENPERIIEHGEDRELTDEEISDEEAVEVRKPKKKTKFQLYLERKKQLKHERKMKEQEQRKQAKQKTDEDANTKLVSGQVEDDERFTALFTDSAFAIDQTSAYYKGGSMAERQVKGKQRRRHLQRSTGDLEEGGGDVPGSTRQKTNQPKARKVDGDLTNEDSLLVEKLKRKSKRKNK